MADEQSNTTSGSQMSQDKPVMGTKPIAKKTTHRATSHVSARSKSSHSGGGKYMFMAIVLIALIVVTGVQAFQLQSLKAKVETGVSLGAASASPAASLQKNLENLPSMVGGC